VGTISWLQEFADDTNYFHCGLEDLQCGMMVHEVAAQSGETGGGVHRSR